MTSPDQGGYYAAARILRTETMHVYNEMSADASRSMGARRYRYIAVLDLKTSETCRLHDGLKDPDTGKFYTYAKRKVGVNFPPLHPWCRSIEAPYINKETLAGMTRPAKDPLTGKIKQILADMTYEEWYKERVESSPDARVNEKMIQHTADDRDQWMRYSEVMEDMPDSLDDFQRKKYSNPSWWENTKQRYRDIKSFSYPF
jgi:SPP1 gp7 family putative phage head morphogenesis protein